MTYNNQQGYSGGYDNTDHPKRKPDIHPVTPPPTLTISQILRAGVVQILTWTHSYDYAPVLDRVLNTFSAANGKSISAAQVSALGHSLAWLPPAALRSLTPAALLAVTSQVLSGATPFGTRDHLINSLTQDQIQHLPESAIAGLASSVLQSTVVATGRSVVASLNSQQLAAISASALGELTLADLTQTSAVKRDKQSITILQGLTSSQVQQINPAAVQNLSGVQLSQINASGHLVWQDIAMNPAQASYLPSAYQWSGLTAIGIASLFTALVRAGRVANLDPAVFESIPTHALANGIGIEMSSGDNGRTFVKSLTNTQLAHFSASAIVGVSARMANLFLNAGASGSLTVSQFQALISGNTNIGQIHPTILANSLSASALLSLTPSQIGQLTASQWTLILGNRTLSQAIYNAGSGKGAWSIEQLRAVSAVAISQTTQNQYLQFSRGLSMFSQAQQDAMSTNVALLEIMVTGQTNVWTQTQIAWIVDNIPGMIPLRGLPGGGASCFKDGVNEKVVSRYTVLSWRTTTDITQILAGLSSAGWGALSVQDRAALLSNQAVPGVLRDLHQLPFMDIMSNASLMSQLSGNNIAALARPINLFLDSPVPVRVRFSQAQLSALIGAEDGADAVGQIARFAPNALPNGGLTPEMVSALIIAVGGAAALAEIARYAPGVLPDGRLSIQNITALIGVAGGASTLAWIAIRAPNVLPGGRLISEHVTALIGTAGGLAALVEIAQNAPAILAGTQLTQIQVNHLLALADDQALTPARRGEALDALTSIAKRVPSMLAGTQLTQPQVDRLLALANNPTLLQSVRRGALAALVHIANGVPSMVAGTKLTQTQVNHLLALADDLKLSQSVRKAALAALTGIAIHVPSMLAGTQLTQPQVDRLLALANNPILSEDVSGFALLALASIAKHVPSMLAGTQLTQPQVDRLLALANNPTLSEFVRRSALVALAGIANSVPSMLAGTQLTQAQVNSLLALVGDLTLTPVGRQEALVALANIANSVPTMLTGIQITANFFALMDNLPELSRGLSNLAQMDLIGGFDEGILTSIRLRDASRSTELEGLVAALIANNHGDWINPSLQNIVDINLQALYTPNGGQSQLNAAALGNSFTQMYQAIQAAQGGNYTLSAAAFEAYAVTAEGGQYLNWLILNHPEVIQTTLTPAVQEQGKAFVGGLSGGGLSSTFLTVAGNNFWNQLADTNPNVIEYMGNNWPNVFSNWSAGAVQALGVNSVNQGQGGFIGLISQNPAAMAQMSRTIASGVAINPNIFNTYATTAPHLLNALIDISIDVASGSSLPFGTLTLAGLVNLIEHGPAVLENAEAAQLSAIPSNILSGLTPTQASLLPTIFWENITTTQLTAMFNSASLGPTFFGSANTLNHISQPNLDAIPAAVLVESVAQAQGIHTAIIENWSLLTNPQQDSLSAANIPDFIPPVIPPPVNSSFAGNPLAINQQVVGGAGVLGGQAYGSDSGLMSAGLNQLIQAMASTNTPVGAVTSSTSVFAGNTSVSSPLTLVSSAVH